MSNARLSVPAKARPGEIILIRLLLEHSMESGFRRDSLGRVVAKNVIHSLVVRYDGREILRAELGSGIAANPYLAFYTCATVSGEVEASWVDDAGVSGSVRAPIAVV